MTSEHAPTRDITIPDSVLSQFRRILTDETDDMTAARVLRETGSSSMDSLFDALATMSSRDPETLGRIGFWRQLAAFFDGRGWGQLTHERIHPGLGIVRSRAWAESDPGADSGEPACDFTSGMLSGIFTRLAGSPIAVLEVGCRSQGDGDCAFAFGSDEAIRRLQALLLETGELETALDRL